MGKSAARVAAGERGMHPILFEMGMIEIHSFGLMMALAWLAAAAYLDRQFGRAGLSRESLGDFLFLVLAGSLIGARALYLVVEYPAWTVEPLSAVFSRSGFVFYGGLIGGGAAGIWSLSRSGLPIARAGDCIAPALALGLGIGRIGCFLAGDDYGRPTDLPWAVTFTDPRSLAPLGVGLHPVQLYLSLNGFLLFGVLHWVYGRKKFDGQVLAMFPILYAATRFGLEYYRGDPRGHYGPFSTSQWIGLLVFPLGIWLYAMFRKMKQT